jgi:hypothetical protein
MFLLSFYRDVAQHPDKKEDIILYYAASKYSDYIGTFTTGIISRLLKVIAKNYTDQEIYNELSYHKFVNHTPQLPLTGINPLDFIIDSIKERIPEIDKNAAYLHSMQKYLQ